jgi:hypothetical protein
MPLLTLANMKHHIKLRHPGRYETDCGKMIRDKNEVTTSRMNTTCEACLKVMQTHIPYWDVKKGGISHAPFNEVYGKGNKS